MNPALQIVLHPDTLSQNPSPERQQIIADNTARVVHWARYQTGRANISRDAIEALIEDGVDADATVICPAHAGEPAQREPFLIMLAGERNLPADMVRKLIRQAKHVNVCSTEQQRPLLWVAARANQTMRNILLDDPRVDIETPDHTATKPYCVTPVNDACACAVHILARPVRPFRNVSITKLLDRGAVLDPYWSRTDRDYGNLRIEFARIQHLQRTILKPYLAQWEMEWKAWQAGDITPDTVTTRHIEHFFSIGKLPAFMASGQWQGREEALISHYSQLPQWVIERQYLIPREMTALNAKTQVHTPLTSWPLGNAPDNDRGRA